MQREASYDLVNLEELLTGDMNTILLRALTPTPHRTFDLPTQPRIKAKNLADAIRKTIELRPYNAWEQRPFDVGQPQKLADSARCGWSVVHATESYDGDAIAWHLL